MEEHIVTVAVTYHVTGRGDSPEQAIANAIKEISSWRTDNLSNLIRNKVVVGHTIR